MPLVVLTTLIRAPIERVFDLARSVDVHVAGTAQTRERVVAGRTSGLFELGDEVTWEATHFGVRQRLSTVILELNRPHYFRDSQVRGAFRRFDHEHHFVAQTEGTFMLDRFDYTAPLGPLGRVADVLFLERYMRNFLKTRNEAIQQQAEREQAELRPAELQPASRD